jgi:hypothetical protein
MGKRKSAVLSKPKPTTRENALVAAKAVVNCWRHVSARELVVFAYCMREEEVKNPHSTHAYHPR